MPLPSFDELRAAVDAVAPRLSVAVAGATDSTVLEAVAQGKVRGWIEPILVGDASAIQATSAEAGIGVDRFRIVDDADSARAAVAEVRSGRARLLMKGLIDTPSLMRALLNSPTGLRTDRTICQVVLMEIVDQQRRILLADTGITIAPTLVQKTNILLSLIELARLLGVDRPRVALVAATEKATSAMVDTLDSAELSRRNAAGEFPDAIVEGPLSFDLAWSADAGGKKQVAGSVVGAADAILFPNLLAGNLTVKAMMYTARSRFGGVLCGAACPVIFMSRADTLETRLNSLALAIRMALAADAPQ
ncbi:MAG TPA: phosphate acyltransferase [Planctomycetaceae bacterium]|jgi:phosphotransacetylase